MQFTKNLPSTTVGFLKQSCESNRSRLYYNCFAHKGTEAETCNLQGCRVRVGWRQGRLAAPGRCRPQSTTLPSGDITICALEVMGRLWGFFVRLLQSYHPSKVAYKHIPGNNGENQMSCGVEIIALNVHPCLQGDGCSPLPKGVDQP